MSGFERILWPLGGGVLGASLLAGFYLGIVSWAGGLSHALDLFWQDRWIVVPMILGFGIQVALYTILKKRLFVPVQQTGPSGVLTGAGGSTSTLAMVACCLHHVTDVLPILGLTAATAFLAENKNAFMALGLGTTGVGIAVMLYILIRERKKAVAHMAGLMETA